MKPKSVKYVIIPAGMDECPGLTEEGWQRADDYENYKVKPTMKSAERYAQKCSNATGYPFVFGERKSRTRWWICYPQEDNCFVEML